MCKWNAWGKLQREKKKWAEPRRPSYRRWWLTSSERVARGRSFLCLAMVPSKWWRVRVPSSWGSSEASPVLPREIASRLCSVTWNPIFQLICYSDMSPRSVYNHPSELANIMFKALRMKMITTIAKQHCLKWIIKHFQSSPSFDKQKAKRMIFLPSHKFRLWLGLTKYNVAFVYCSH